MAIFTKTLSSSDIERRLTIPGDCAVEFPPFHRGQHNEFNVKDDEGGHQWIFRCAPSATNSGIVINSGWLQFARSKNLEVGDKIHFQKGLDHSTRAHHYRIGVTKKKQTK
ncbi:hypothetical protein LWI29_019999 [Acer saccharum]|uniref:TF-B3 domain-containing protein n=1 Tax=Acer saccharum TaxID=4024 RepID=A0AA39SJF8_ACESA|nr:hypothetical protein LWI29_019999 [Acer saccharum]